MVLVLLLMYYTVKALTMPLGMVVTQAPKPISTQILPQHKGLHQHWKASKTQ